MKNLHSAVGRPAQSARLRRSILLVRHYRGANVRLSRLASSRCDSHKNWISAAGTGARNSVSVCTDFLTLQVRGPFLHRNAALRIFVYQHLTAANTSVSCISNGFTTSHDPTLRACCCIKFIACRLPRKRLSSMATLSFSQTQQR